MAVSSWFGTRVSLHRILHSCADPSPALRELLRRRQPWLARGARGRMSSSPDMAAAAGVACEIRHWPTCQRRLEPWWKHGIDVLGECKCRRVQSRAAAKARGGGQPGQGSSEAARGVRSVGGP
eukprot:GHVR01072047.1.p1 GENE.GHVR01072047.1~~GHVR01072047.1.p1  ORF type:complete len:123 (-),score=26.37 GHVR01072047.1:182-550(-)